MGEVYKATDTRLNRTVAIKVLPPHFAHDPDMRERFNREAQTIAGLNHPHICTLHDVGSGSFPAHEVRLKSRSTQKPRNPQRRKPTDSLRAFVLIQSATRGSWSSCPYLDVIV